MEGMRLLLMDVHEVVAVGERSEENQIARIYFHVIS